MQSNVKRFELLSGLSKEMSGSQSSLRRYLGAIKDTTTVSLAKVNSGYKVRDKLFSFF